VARGWGRSEEDLAADKEQVAEDRIRKGERFSAPELERAARRRSIEMSLARIEDQLRRVASPVRRQALELARSELRRQIAALDRPPEEKRSR
jgi:hypothetical protein